MLMDQNKIRWFTAATTVFLISLNAGVSASETTTAAYDATTLDTTSLEAFANETTATSDAVSLTQVQTETTNVANYSTGTTTSTSKNANTETTLSSSDNDATPTITTASTLASAVTTSPSISLNLSSVIDVLMNSHEVQDVLTNFNLTINLFFENLMNFTENQSNSVTETLFNSMEGEILLEMLRANASTILGQYSREIETEAEQVYFYALLLDLQQNLKNSSFLEDFIQATNYDSMNSTYTLNSASLAIHICRIYTTAGGTNACTLSTSTTTTTMSSANADPPVAIIVGCVVGAGGLLIITIALIGYFCTKSSAGKVAPSDEIEFSRPGSKNCFCNDSLASVNQSSRLNS